MSTVRLRRLQADYEKVRDYVNRHPRLQLIQADGTPPEALSTGVPDSQLAAEGRRPVDGQEPHGGDRPAAELSADAAPVPDAHADLPSQHRAARDLHRRPLEPRRAALVDRRADRGDDRLPELQHPEPAQRRGRAMGRPARRRAAAGPGEHDARRRTGRPSPAVPSSSPARPAPPPAAPSASRRRHRCSPPAAAIAASPPAPEAERHFACPQCGSIARWRPELAGKQLRCPRCQTVFRCPA